MAVKEKAEQGGGLGPVVGGVDHLPEEGEVTQLVLLVSLILHSQLSTLKLAAYLSSCVGNTVPTYLL